VTWIVKLGSLDWKEIEKNINSLNARRGIANIIFPIKINQKLGSIVGHILGDGSIDKKYQQVFFSNSDKTLLKEFESSMKEIFGIEPRIWMQNKPEFGNTSWDKRLKSIRELKDGRNGALFYPTICGLILNDIFDDFSIGRDKRITKEMLNTDKEFKAGLIRAFYDDESSVGNKNIRVFQDRKEILETFRKLLSEFSITASSVKSYKKRDIDRYYFDIFRKSNIRIFEKEIGFTSPKKNDKLNEIINRKPHGNDR